MLTDLLERARQLLAERQVEQALAAFQDAERAGADADVCAASRWECVMLLGRYEEAWRASDEIEERGRRDGPIAPERFWDGQPLGGKHVMLRCLHGYGDALQFIRYALLIRSQAASLCVETHPELVELLRACHGVVQVITWGPQAPTAPPFWDTQIEIMEVPRIFRAMPATIPVIFPYLDVTKLTGSETTASLVRKINQGRAQGRLQVGLSWRSSNWNPLRSLPLQLLAFTLSALDKCDLYSLQQDGAIELQQAAAQTHCNIGNMESEFSDIAMRIAALDVVVTIDGVLAHLAGALGIPVLLLLPHAADWRWGFGETTPWYPRTRIFRQRQPGDWTHPVKQSVAALKHLSER